MAWREVSHLCILGNKLQPTKLTSSSTFRLTSRRPQRLEWPKTLRKKILNVQKVKEISSLDISGLLNIFKCNFSKTYLGGGFKHFLFSSLPGRWSNLTNIFSDGWFNHQPVTYIFSQKKDPLEGFKCGLAGLALGSLLAAMAMFVSAYVECWHRDWTPRLPGRPRDAEWLVRHFVTSNNNNTMNLYNKLT